MQFSRIRESIYTSTSVLLQSICQFDLKVAIRQRAMEAVGGRGRGSEQEQLCSCEIPGGLCRELKPMCSRPF
jgi:hypothetical protein